MSTDMIGAGLVLGLLGIGVAYQGWKKRRQHQLVTETPTTEIRSIDDEGRVELKGTVTGPADDEEGFVAPISNEDGTLLAAWEMQEWSEHGDHSEWNIMASGVHSVPFLIDDGTDSVRVAIEDRADGGTDWMPSDRGLASEGTAVDGVVCEFEEFPSVTIDAESEPPQHIREFVKGETSVSEQTGSITNLIDVGNAHGDRRYHEQTLRKGNDTYVLGHVRANEGATMPLHPEDVVVTPDEEEKFIISDQTEAELTDDLGGTYRFFLAGGVVFVLVAVGLVVAGATPIL